MLWASFRFCPWTAGLPVSGVVQGLQKAIVKTPRGHLNWEPVDVAALFSNTGLACLLLPEKLRKKKAKSAGKPPCTENKKPTHTNMGVSFSKHLSLNTVPFPCDFGVFIVRGRAPDHLRVPSGNRHW